MNKRRLIKWLLFFFLLLNIKAMNAQNNTIPKQSLDAGQQSLVAISALTAVGELEGLKVQLNAGLDAGLSVNE